MSAPGGSTQAARIAKGKADAERLFPLLKEKFAAAVIEENLEGIDPWLVVDPAGFLDICRHLNEDAAFDCDLLSLISTVDYLPKEASEGSAEDAGRVEVVYFFESTTKGHRICVKVKLPRDNPSIPSVESIWKTANWHEREAFDLMGIHFEGHPNLVRILCAEDWVGHALRKDYVIPERVNGIKNIVY